MEVAMRGLIEVGFVIGVPLWLVFATGNPILVIGGFFVCLAAVAGWRAMDEG